jgi:hypothetical protein
VNQDFAALEMDAGYNVWLAGSLQGDTITVSKVTMAATENKAA